MEFIIGCNYWASNAGTEMWKNWDYSVVENDIRILSENGVSYLRVFPNWRDFQPILPMIEEQRQIREYRFIDESIPQNEYFLDESMLKNFESFCDICEKYNIKLIVGLLTGWMSGRLFIPPALIDKNLYTDPTALLFEQRFVMGFVSRFKDRNSIYAWDLGNECNCMDCAEDSYAATNWTAIISNAIKSQDNSRPVISGMHALGLDERNSSWTIGGQSEFTDILTTHPYPFWLNYSDKDEVLSYRTTIHATFQTKLYSDIGKKPCLVEEIGTMGPMLCEDEAAAKFIRCNLFSNYANGSLGLMWWCANEQASLTTPPYTWNMCEVELGMLDLQQNPKPVLKEIKAFSDFVKKSALNFSAPKPDVVCVLTEDQEQEGVGYMSYCLAKQCGINLEFKYCHQDIPLSDFYLMPSINKQNVIPAEKFNTIKQRVRDGATLCISNDNGILSGFNKLTGLKVVDASLVSQIGRFGFEGEEIEFRRERKYRVIAENAQILASDEENIPIVTVNNFGKGKVYYINFPLEKMLFNETNAFNSNKHLLYKTVFSKVMENKKVISNNKYIAITENCEKDGTLCFAINHSNLKQPVNLQFKNCKVDEVLYGNIEELEPFDAAVFRIK